MPELEFKPKPAAFNIYVVSIWLYYLFLVMRGVELMSPGIFQVTGHLFLMWKPWSIGVTLA